MQADRPPASSYWFTRFVILRALGAIYAVAFLAAARQLVPLIGSHGLLPLDAFVRRVQLVLGSRSAAFLRLPSIFWFAHSDSALRVVSWTGFALALVVMSGYANAILMALLWVLYMSIVHVGQDWYGYGWEIQLLETGFLAIFLCPLLDGRPFPRREPPMAVIWLLRCLVFRIMLGAGLIKIRGDEAWRDLTALYFHFQSQPIPNPLSRTFHFLPHVALKIGTAFNHVAELIAPWFVFTRFSRRVAGGVIIAFQLTIILSGNLSFLNWLTIVPALACFDDAVWARLLPRMKERTPVPSRAMRYTSYGLAVVIGVLSIQPVLNMISPQQIMNTSFDPLDLVNTYGAFGSVGRERLNVVFQGTDDDPDDEHAVWHDYEYAALPVAIHERPVQIAPYQPRLDWQMWFAAMGTVDQYPWTLHVVWKLLHDDRALLSLFGKNPFEGHAPRAIRAVRYRYEFLRPGSDAYWKRTSLDAWLPPLTKDDPQLLDAMKQLGWSTSE